MNTRRVPVTDLSVTPPDAVLIDGIPWDVAGLRLPDLTPGDLSVTRTTGGLTWEAHLAFVGHETVDVWQEPR